MLPQWCSQEVIQTRRRPKRSRRNITAVSMDQGFLGKIRKAGDHREVVFDTSELRPLEIDILMDLQAGHELLDRLVQTLSVECADYQIFVNRVNKQNFQRSRQSLATILINGEFLMDLDPDSISPEMVAFKCRKMGHKIRQSRINALLTENKTSQGLYQAVKFKIDEAPKEVQNRSGSQCLRPYKQARRVGPQLMKAANGIVYQLPDIQRTPRLPIKSFYARNIDSSNRYSFQPQQQSNQSARNTSVFSCDHSSGQQDCSVSPSKSPAKQSITPCTPFQQLPAALQTNRRFNLAENRLDNSQNKIDMVKRRLDLSNWMSPSHLKQTQFKKISSIYRPREGLLEKLLAKQKVGADVSQKPPLKL